MPNGVRARGNSQVANRRRNQRRDIAVRAEMVAPEIVIQAEPFSVQADPDITQQLRLRIAQLEAQVKQVKRNYKSAKKQADGNDNIIANMSQYFKKMSGEIGLTDGDCLSPTWLNTFTSKVKGLQGERDSTRLLYVSSQAIADLATQERDTAEAKYHKAINGTLLAFQEAEIEDLKDQNDRLMKLNKTLLNRGVERKDQIEAMLEINANLVEDFAKVINKIGSKKVNIDGMNTSTAECLEKYVVGNPDFGMVCVSPNRGLVIQGKHLIDTDSQNIYGYNPKTKVVYDDDDGEILGKLIRENGKLKIQWQPPSSDSDSD
jgi:hypothetical protein